MTLVEQPARVSDHHRLAHGPRKGVVADAIPGFALGRPDGSEIEGAVGHSRGHQLAWVGAIFAGADVAGAAVLGARPSPGGGATRTRSPPRPPSTGST